MKDVLLNLKESAEVMGCAYGKAFRLAHSGKYGFYKVGNTWMIPKSRLYEELGLKIDEERSDTQCA